ncbi:MAG: methyltransferase domain-containing protein [Vicinamibacterales bacterium]
MKRRIIAGVLVLVVVLVPVVFVLTQALQTLDTLAIVERERDTWQRPDDILAQLQVGPGATVVDFGSGAGYFALKIARRVAPIGKVWAVDLRRQSLAFLWYRAWREGHPNLQVIRGEVNNPKLPAGPVDAVLIANTYHELTEPGPILDALFRAMRPGARLVVVDRGPRVGGEPRAEGVEHHDITLATVTEEVARHGFEVSTTDTRFIDRSGEEDIWWLIVFRKP